MESLNYKEKNYGLKITEDVFSKSNKLFLSGILYWFQGFYSMATKLLHLRHDV